MMVTIKSESCPNEETLSDFLLGKSSTVELEKIARHLGTCSECSSTARSLEARTDALIDSLRQALSEGDCADEPACLEGSKSVASRHFSASPVLAGDANATGPLGLLGTYELLEEVGRGGTGVVYRAKHTRLKNIVAVKVLPAEALMRPDTLARFDREMAAIGQLEHPHIVKATDAGEDEGRHFLVMEYVAGGNLATLVNRQGPLPVVDAIACILQAARGLSYSHAKGMIHRDVKPSNLLLGADGVVKVSDLGLARVLLDAEDEGSTHTGSLMGTFDYMAPEQALNAKKADERADIYGLGCTLYFLLTGTQPFGSDSAFETLIAHREQPTPSLRHVRSNVPRSLDRLMQRMMAKAPGHRPGTMDQIIQELVSLRLKNNLGINDNLCHLLSTELREVDLRPRKKARRWLPSHKPKSLLTAAAIGTLVGSLVVSAGFLLSRNPEKPFLTPGTSAARFEVHLVQADEGVTIKDLADAIKLLEGDLSSKSKTSGRFRFIDFIDPMSNSGGFFDADLAFPGFNVLNNTEQSNHFALRAVATVSIPRTGYWTFGVISDDGFRLSIDGKIVGEHKSSRTQAGSFIPVKLTETGPHVLELIYFEGTGGADLEICVAEGKYDDFEGDAFRLIGASYDGGLPLLRPGKGQEED